MVPSREPVGVGLTVVIKGSCYPMTDGLMNEVKVVLVAVKQTPGRGTVRDCAAA